jgi:hypothetical protein
MTAPRMPLAVDEPHKATATRLLFSARLAPTKESTMGFIHNPNRHGRKLPWRHQNRARSGEEIAPPGRHGSLFRKRLLALVGP